MRHGIGDVASKITALNGEDVCSIYGCGTDFLLQLVGGTDRGGHFGLFVSNTTQLGVGGGGGTGAIHYASSANEHHDSDLPHRGHSVC